MLWEAFEETDLAGLRVVRYLGAGEYDVRPYAEAIHVRHYFHLTTDADTVPERWIGVERGDGAGERIRFELYWVRWPRHTSSAPARPPSSDGSSTEHKPGTPRQPAGLGYL